MPVGGAKLEMVLASRYCLQCKEQINLSHCELASFAAKLWVFVAN